MLPAYYNHVRSFENTLVTKFFGLHCVKLTGATQRKVRIITSDIQTIGLISTVLLESELVLQCLHNHFFLVFQLSI